MANINKIKLSGTTYNIQDENACKVVELTQAEYDALPATAKTSNSLFVITDATAGDLSNYYTKSETSGATQISTALASKQDQLVSGTNIKTINNQSLLGEGNITIEGGGGGKAVSAGTNISITTGETADTINCTLPIETISNSYGVSQIYVGDNIYKNNNYGAIVIASKDNSSTDTDKTRVEFADGAISIGSTNNVFHNGIAIGKNATAGARNSWGHIAIGTNVKATGSTKTNINNQIKVDTSNQVYIYNKDNTEMICLQDQLGGGGGGVNVVQTTGTSTADVMSQNAVTDAFNTYTARRDNDEGIVRFWTWQTPSHPYGTNYLYNFSINGKLPLSKQTKSTDYSNIFNFHLVETSAITTSITSSSTDVQVPSAKAVYDQLGGLKLVKLTQSEYDALSTKDSNTLYVIVN